MFCNIVYIHHRPLSLHYVSKKDPYIIDSNLRTDCQITIQLFEPKNK